MRNREVGVQIGQTVRSAHDIQRRRQRSAHNPRGVHLTDEIVLDPSGCQAVLNSGQHLDPAQRLLLLVAIQSGDVVMTFADLRKRVLVAAYTAGSVEAAIRKLTRSVFKKSNHV
jgi:hypothetical protein